MRLIKHRVDWLGMSKMNTWNKNNKMDELQIMYWALQTMFSLLQLAQGAPSSLTLHTFSLMLCAQLM